MGMTVKVVVMGKMVKMNGGDEQDSDHGGVEVPEYLGHPGCTQDMANKNPIDFFQLFVTDAMLEVVVEQTNLFAQQFIDSHDLTRRSRVQQWGRSPHDLVELKKFLAMTIDHHGTHQLPMYRGLLGHFMAICHRHV